MKYYPFGSLVPNRHGSSASYRYGFQGQEKDDEIKGEGNSLNYTFRMHDPRLGRFFAVDPLAPKYPFYSPYQFSGNRVIDMVELEGLEPAEPDQKEYKNLTTAIDSPFRWSGGDEAYSDKKDIFGSSVPVDKVNQNLFFGNNPDDKMMRYVNQDSQCFVSKATENKFKSERELVNTLLGNFIWGDGPENIVFPENGKFSNSLKNSIAVGETLVEWAKGGHKDGQYNWGMDTRGEINVGIHSGYTSLEHFLGSVSLTIKKVDENKIKVEIFNITSFTSGNIYKDLPFGKTIFGNPNSTVRESNQSSPYLTSQRTYSNTSQHFSFTLSSSELGKILRQYSGGTIKK
ncbi:RHS repeat domain-containing protein [Flavobacterium covae]